MSHDAFDRPVEVFVGLGMPRAIRTPFQAYTFLRETPGERHSALHRRACEATLSAIDGRAGPADARAAIAAYAAAAGILAPELDAGALGARGRERAARPLA